MIRASTPANRLAVAPQGHPSDRCPCGATVKRAAHAILIFVSLAPLTGGCASLHVPTFTPAAPPVDPFALCRSHNFAAAETAFAQPGNCATPDAWLARADCDRRLHEPAKEFDSLKQAVRQFPHSVPAWIALAKFEIRSGRPDRADLALQRAILLEPNNTDAWCERGLLRLRQHRNDDAMACFTRASGGPTTDVASTFP